jgi:hypothetical protein
MRLSAPADQLFGFDDIKLNHDSVLDFWLWSYSILANDPTKGEFAEWMVGNLLGLSMIPGGRIEGADWDLRTPEGVKIEVKAAAYWQAWKLRNREDGGWRKATPVDYEKMTPIRFTGLYRAPATGPMTKANFKADVYVFCLQREQDPEKWNGVDLRQWSFFILPKSKLAEAKEARDAKVKNGKLPKSFDLTLAQLEALSCRMTAIEFQRKAPQLFRSLSPGQLVR